MKRFALLLPVAAFLTFAMSAPLCAADQDFVLVNDTGFTIDQVFVSPAAATDWQEDVLGQDVLEDGDDVEINFSRKETECAWDIMIVNSDGDKYYWKKIDLCKYATITLHYEDGKAWADFEDPVEESEAEPEAE